MTLHAAVLAYVRTGDPDDPTVVELAPGDPVPDDALEWHVEQLTAAGVLVEGKAKPPMVAEVLDEVGDDPAKAAAALEVERAGQNRKTLVKALEDLLPGGGVAGPVGPGSVEG